VRAFDAHDKQQAIEFLLSCSPLVQSLVDGYKPNQSTY
jgi:hypothetical protein